MKKILLIVFCAVLVSTFGLNLMLPSNSSAVPSFARTKGTTCNTCHTQWPLLNETGRQFLEQGFTPGEQLTVDNMSMQKSLPISARLNLRLIDKRTSKDKTSALTDADKELKMRSLHEGEIFTAGRMKDFSYFFELESEDEWSGKNSEGDTMPGFQVQLAMGYVGWHKSPALNVRAGYTSPFGADGRNTVNQTKPGRYEWAASANGFVPGVSQTVNLYGTVAENLFYSIAWHGNEGLLEGNDAKDLSGRVAYDIAGVGASVGGFLDLSKEYPTDDKTSRYGIDAQWLRDNIQVNAIFAVKDVDATDKKDSVIGLFGQYIFTDGDTPQAAVALNLDKYTENDGDDKWTKTALVLTYFAMDNVKFQAGWEGTLSAPDTYENKESRITLVADLGF